ncbi:hypothetical protein F4804DRAFT_308374 [Jackrogersella minutella]|nr:hypothetical protein F4804DRAFT_308374 [Jackrogersella minutella]
MGNSLSSEAPSWRGQRTTQKLSKPKTGNPTAAGLLNPKSFSNSSRPSTAARRLSPEASPALPETVPDIPSSVSDDKKGLDIGRRLSRRLFRSNTSKEFSTRQKRSGSVDLPTPQQERWSSRASSMRNGPEEGQSYGYFPTQGSFSVNASRTSSNYDLGSYEAKRLLNLLEEPSWEDNSVTSGSNMYIPEGIRSDLRGRRPSAPETTPAISRANSQISLYTPMRRRSLMTPGLATREAPGDPVLSKRRVRNSLPATPAHRESMESINVEANGFPFPLPSNNPDLIPRALTPSEAEYKQTGAFKLGTLRIVNGSPARSPTRCPSDIVDSERPKRLLTDGPAEYHFETEKLAANGAGTEKADVHNGNDSSHPSKSPPTNLAVPTWFVQTQSSSQFLPKHQLSSPSYDEGKLKVPEMQVTSKHTAMEDQLFDDDQNEYSSVEVIDVRVDANAKSSPQRPKLVSEKRKEKYINRSDSGIASPASECSPVPLSKADSGYSSSVSIRSFSRPAPEKDPVSDDEFEAVSNANMKQTIGVGKPETASSTTMPTSTAVPMSLDEASPPPVPLKDPHLQILSCSRAPGEVSPSFQQNPKSLGPLKCNEAPAVRQSPTSTQIQATCNMETHRTGLHSPSTSNSRLRMSTGIRKPGKLQRFLSGGRVPLTAYSTHPTEHARVPAVSGDMRAKLQSHTGSVPVSFRRLALKSAASKETLGTILSVGSAELLQDDEVSPKSSGGQLWAPDRNQITSISIGSTFVQTPFPDFAKKPIPRKPVPIRSKDSSTIRESNSTLKAIENRPEENKIIGTEPSRNTSGRTYGSTSSITTSESERSSALVSRPTRSNTMPDYVVGAPKTTHPGTGPSDGPAQDKSHSLTSLELPPVMPATKLSKSPPPVSMRTRTRGSLRVLPPMRPRSTPPDMRWSGRPPHSRRGSQEGNLRSTELTTSLALDHTALHRSSSQGNFRCFSPAQPYYYAEEPSVVPAAGNSRSMSLRPETAEARVPNWGIQTDHGPSVAPPSSDDIQRGLLTSQSSQRSSAATDPSFVQRQHYANLNPPSLHRKSSYDEYNLVPEDSSIRDNGPYPSISRNGQAYVTDPWSGRSMSMPQKWDQAWNRPSQHAPGVPRHQRHRSLDQFGNPMPYRVLHSYNSPAYRHVPIWR